MNFIKKLLNIIFKKKLSADEIKRQKEYICHERMNYNNFNERDVGGEASDLYKECACNDDSALMP